MDSEHTHAPEGPDSTGHYQIRIRGHLGRRWEGYFGAMTLSPEAGGTCLLEGPVHDQAELHAVLRQIRDLGIELVSVVRGPPG